MKALKIILLVSLLTSCGIGQIEYYEIDEVSETISINQSKDEIFVNSNLWLVESFISAKSIIQYSDKEAGVIAGKFKIMDDPFNNNIDRTVEAIIKIFANEGSVKISIKPLPYPRYQNFGYRTDETVTLINSEMQNLIESLEQYLKNSGL